MPATSVFGSASFGQTPAVTAGKTAVAGQKTSPFGSTDDKSKPSPFGFSGFGSGSPGFGAMQSQSGPGEEGPEEDAFIGMLCARLHVHVSCARVMLLLVSRGVAVP